MKGKTHTYVVNVEWTGNLGKGTRSYTEYARNHTVSLPQKSPILCSSDPSFRGDPSRYNPEELLVAALSMCHMLWYLHLASVSGITVTRYEDKPSGSMIEREDGGGYFSEVVLHPCVTAKSGADPKQAAELHERAHHLCFIANSVNFQVRCAPELQIEPD